MKQTLLAEASVTEWVGKSTKAQTGGGDTNVAWRGKDTLVVEK